MPIGCHKKSSAFNMILVGQYRQLETGKYTEEKLGEWKERITDERKREEKTVRKIVGEDNGGA